jgi:hypothetical protein
VKPTTASASSAAATTTAFVAKGIAFAWSSRAWGEVFMGS